MKKLRWIIINGIFVVCLYAGYVLNMDGALNVALFFAWLTIIASFFALSEPVQEKLKEESRTLPAWADWIFDGVITAVFVWFGAWITGLFYFMHIFFQQAAWDKVEKEKEVNNHDQ